VSFPQRGGPRVSISGSNAVGSTLTATVAGGTATGYQWKRNGANISGATASTYVIQSADAGTTLTVVATVAITSGNSVNVPASVNVAQSKAINYAPLNAFSL
jgi:hypothetical protein